MMVTDGRERDWGVVFVNDAFVALTGYARQEVLGRNPRFLQGPDTDPAAVEVLRAALRDGQEVGVELLNYRKDGSTFWNGMFLSPVRSPEGDIAYWFGSQLDITPRKLAELAMVQAHGEMETTVEERNQSLRATVEQKTVLLHEVEHRVKNNLQLISSLIQFQSRRTDDPGVKAALRQVQERVSAVSTVHRRLFQTEDAGRFDVAQFLRDLADDLVGRARREDIAIEFDLQPIRAAAAKAAPLALLVNEILTAAIGIGLPTGRPGALFLGLHPSGEEFVIEVGDDGAWAPDDARQALAGPSGIVEILRRQLGAAIEWRDNQPGVTTLITLPMERV
jgi:PAS domain S-box-containing protein